MSTCIDEKVTKESLIYALNAVTSYNGLAGIIEQWLEPGYFKDNGGGLSWDWEKYRSYVSSDRDQIQVIWMICVMLFGNYGTSPRTDSAPAPACDSASPLTNLAVAAAKSSARI